jgi:hypothetical protein
MEQIGKMLLEDSGSNILKYFQIVLLFPVSMRTRRAGLQIFRKTNFVKKRGLFF